MKEDFIARQFVFLFETVGSFYSSAEQNDAG